MFAVSFREVFIKALTHLWFFGGKGCFFGGVVGIVLSLAKECTLVHHSDLIDEYL